LKVSDIESSYLYNGTSSEDTNDSAGSEKSLATLLREAHFALMELAGKTAGILAANSTTDPNQYLQMATLDKDLNKWYTQLPQQLCWTSENIVTAPYPFFMLHQQYHSTLILLHRSFANQEDYGNGNVENSHLAKLSRIACTRNAVKVAQIYWQHRQRFDTKMISISGVQHAVSQSPSAQVFRDSQWSDRRSDRSFSRYSIPRKPQRPTKSHTIPGLPLRSSQRHVCNVPAGGAHVQCPSSRHGRCVRRHLHLQPGDTLRAHINHRSCPPELFV
jgi:hypothetical protein